MFEDGAIINELLIERLNYIIYVVLLLIGLHAMISKQNLIKKLIGMSIFQTAIILFYVSIAVKDNATIPIYKTEHDPHGDAAKAAVLDLNRSGEETKAFYAPVMLKPEETQQYSNPLPHVLMLTAIVVGVATLGLALALCLRIQQGYGTVEEDELLVKIERSDARYSQSPLAKAKNRRRTQSRNTRKPRTSVKSTKSIGKSAKSLESRDSTKTKKTTSKSNLSQPKKKPASTSRKPRSSSSKVEGPKPTTPKAPAKKASEKTRAPKKKGAE